ncbi:U3 small nucleolar ribonucleoprotein protein MPP10 [Teleopsis dalmanni]|uniref:U3 small nucleolar ribonucleoprotein protein MPP10 n=1 Tax=Teleopsis dalmanni TaxID=139649 RepID=UPI0018CE4E4F|nr:U3 small nucleolar ribonucleoprotein protein MPP10 [Teleopsis dalmanni]XP_037957743.1 U3 small nucleolar ribonucleoprotein protein MPP10 [Teleopsis dalmanni]XP_037957744.1 U3 small nucleolar ribonucleoprotein protein MPP10 [Teleopsis dalmanni]
MAPAMANFTNDKDYNKIATKFTNITKKPEKFLSARPEKYDDIQNLLQNTYRLAAIEDSSNKAARVEVLSELYVDGMEEEQIWQQLELRNEFVMSTFLEQTAKLFALQETKLEIRLDEGDSDVGSENDDNTENDDIDDEDENEVTDEEDNNELKNLYDNDRDGGDDDEDDDDDGEEFGSKQSTLFKNKTKKKKIRPSVVDDKFFKLDEMADFLDAEDAKEVRKQKNKPKIDDNDGIDYFAEDLGEDDADDDSENDHMNYKDFFDEDEDAAAENIKDKEKVVHKSQNNDKNNFHPEDENDDHGEDVDEEDEDDVDEAEEHNAFDNADDDYKENEDIEDSDVEEAALSKKLNQKGKPIAPASDTGTDSDSDQVDEMDEKTKSSYEQRQERLNQLIQNYESEILGEKPWQMKGEVQATNRPQNSLLEEILEFESTSRPAPVITETTTKRLEDIIRQRIKDQAWDDVVPIVRPTHTVQDYRKLLVLDQEKSKESLAQIYEKEYQKEIDKLDPNRDDTVEEEPKEHKDIKERMRKLFLQLDALSNFYFTPKPVAPEAKIITNTPAINMEEVAPVTVTDAKLLAPEEVYRGPKHELLGKSERTRTDKNRERRKKKQKQRAINKVLEKKDIQRQKLGIPLSKKEENAKILKTITKHRNVKKLAMDNEQPALKSSKAFFSKLQETTTAAATKRAAKKKADSTAISAKKFKL